MDVTSIGDSFGDILWSRVFRGFGHAVLEGDWSGRMSTWESREIGDLAQKFHPYLDGCVLQWSFGAWLDALL